MQCKCGKQFFIKGDNQKAYLAHSAMHGAANTMHGAANTMHVRCGKQASISH